MDGITVMLGHLMGDDESAKAFKRGVGKEIGNICLSDDQLVFIFTDGYKMIMSDDGQSCCEHRYMTTDDDLSYFSGATLMDAEIAGAPDKISEYGEPHEVQFLKIKTSTGIFTMENHNEHNGYYGGFYVVVREG